MKERIVSVVCEQGLHLREAAKIVEASQQLKSRITFCRGCQYADSCSILELLLLGASQGSEIKITAEGDDEATAVDCMAGIVNMENSSSVQSP